MLTGNDINEQFQKQLGRNATSSEISDLQRYAGTGYADLGASDIGEIIQGLPEYQNRALQSYGGQYANALGQGDQRLLGLAQNQLLGQFAGMGRDLGGSGYVNAFAQAAQNLALQRQQTLANFYGQGYQNIMGNSFNQSQGALGFGRNQNVLGVQRSNQLTDINRQRQWDIEDYNRQKADFGSYLAQMNRQRQGQFLGGGLLGLAGAGLGGWLGGNAGRTTNEMGVRSPFNWSQALSGAQMGGGIGSIFGQGLF